WRGLYGGYRAENVKEPANRGRTPIRGERDRGFPTLEVAGGKCAVRPVDDILPQVQPTARVDSIHIRCSVSKSDRTDPSLGSKSRNVPFLRTAADSRLPLLSMTKKLSSDRLGPVLF